MSNTTQPRSDVLTTIDQIVQREFGAVHAAMATAANNIADELRAGRVAWTTAELACMVGLKPEKIHNEHRFGRIRAIKLGGKLHFTLPAIEDWFDAYDTHGTYRDRWLANQSQTHMTTISHWATDSGRNLGPH